MTRQELRDYVEEQRNLDNIPYHVYSALVDGIDMLEQGPILAKIRTEIISIAFDWQEIDGEHESFMVVNLNEVLDIIDKYNADGPSIGTSAE